MISVTSASDGAISTGGQPSGPWHRSSITVTVSSLLSISGIIRRSPIHVFSTGSSHTLCQIPLVGVYQIPPGFSTCLPLGWRPLSVGSVTFTTMLCVFVSARKGVILQENGSYPPRWLTAKLSSIHTVVSQSEASKFIMICLSFHPFGTVNSREYQRASESVMRAFTPERADSAG